MLFKVPTNRRMRDYSMLAERSYNKRVMINRPIKFVEMNK